MRFDDVGIILGLPNILRNGGDEAESETPFLVVRIMHDGQAIFSRRAATSTPIAPRTTI